MPISRTTLLKAGFTEYDATGATGDPYCVGYFQKRIARVFLDVSLWKFSGAIQVNFEVPATDRELSLDLGMRGVPKTWSVAELEAYVTALLKRVKRPAPKTARS